MARSLSPTVPSNFSERRIIALENYMLSTHLRGAAALDAFNILQMEIGRRPATPLVPHDPLGLRLASYYRMIDTEIAMMRGNKDYWKWHEVRKGY